MSAIGLWWTTALMLLLLMVPTLIALIMDRRELDSDRVWAKPLKFQLSLAVHFATLALLAQDLPTTVIEDWPFYGGAVLSVVATVFEILYIGIQAARQQKSHFNFETPLTAMLYGLMAIGAVMITAAAALVGILLLCCETPSIGYGLKIGGGVGLIGGTALTFVTAFRMGATMTRYNGEEKAGAARMAVTGWSLSVADRRIPHFLATHMMQVLPATGLIVDPVLPPLPSAFVVLLCAGGYAFVTLQTFRRVNRGQVIAWPGPFGNLFGRGIIEPRQSNARSRSSAKRWRS